MEILCRLHQAAEESDNCTCGYYDCEHLYAKNLIDKNKHTLIAIAQAAEYFAETAETKEQKGNGLFAILDSLKMLRDNNGPDY